MIQLLYIVAIFLVGFAIFAPLLGIIPFTLIGLINNMVLAILFLALANIIGNQEDILDQLNQQDDRQRKLLLTQKKICSRCNHNYDTDYKSCPKCGNIEE